MTLLRWIVLLVAGVGHLGLWSAAYNQLHATALSRPIRKIIEKLIYLIVIVVAAAMIAYTAAPDFVAANLGGRWASWIEGYLWLCLLAAFFLTGRWLMMSSKSAPPPHLVAHTNDSIDFRKQCPPPHVRGLEAHLLDLIPGNQSWQVATEKKTLVVPRLPPQYDGITLLHLSDLHLTGKISRCYFEHVIERANDLRPDIVCLTGDIVDTPACVPWVRPLLVKLQAQRAKFFVLGNHDRRIRDIAGLRATIREAGFVDLGHGAWHALDRSAKLGDTIWFAGNELPWFPGANQLEYAFGRPPAQAMRVLLSHSPDQLWWAVQRNFDLVLAGHTHGGQVRFPLIGPVISPSRHGVRFAGGRGVFLENDTLMHVTRGLSGDQPIRWNCRPELALLTLVRSPKLAESQSDASQDLPESDSRATPPTSQR